MGFSFNSKAAKAEQKQRRERMTVGIQENAYLEKVELGVHEATSSKYMDIVYVRKDNDTESLKRMWWPSDSPYQREGETKDQAIQREINDKIRTMSSILECYMSLEEAEINASSFDDYVSKFKARLDSKKFNEIPVRVKLIWDTAFEYPEISKYGNWVERQIQDVPTKLRYTKYEQENRLNPDKVEKPKSDSTILDDTKDLPF
jgi:hypothetical protein